MKIPYFLFVFLFPLTPANAQADPEEKNILHLVDQFFVALEKQDTLAFRDMFMKDARNYSVRELGDSVRIRSQLPSGFRFTPGQIVKERMRKESTLAKIAGRIAMVWAPYDLWVNETFSHCGVDVFTFIKTSTGWKIASVSYTMETTGCH